VRFLDEPQHKERITASSSYSSIIKTHSLTHSLATLARRTETMTVSFHLPKISTSTVPLLLLLLISSSIIATVSGFDPLQLQSKVSFKQFRRYQEVEIKHARVAMLAVTGILVAENWHPIAPLVNGPAITHLQQCFADGDPVDAPIKTYRALIQLSTMGLLELKSIIASFEVDYEKTEKGQAPQYTGFLREEYVIGDAEFDPLGLYKEAEFPEVREKELAVGRLAMVAVVGILAQENVDHLSVVEHFLRP
jgi:hypothetical protein